MHKRFNHVPGNIGRFGYMLRKILAAVPLVTVVILIAAVVPAFVPSGQWLQVDSPEADIRTDGVFAEITVSAEVRSKMVHDISGLTFELYLVDDSKGSSVRVLSSEPQDIRHDETVRYEASERFFYPTAVLILSDLIAEEGSVIHLLVDADCGYLWGMLSFTTSTQLDVSLAEEGESVSLITERNDDTALTVTISGLREGLRPDDMHLEISGEGYAMTMDITVTDGTVHIDVGSVDGLTETIGGLTGCDELAVTDDGEPVDVDTATVIGMLNVLEDIRGIL